MQTTRLLSILAIGVGCATALAQTADPGGRENLNISQIMGAMGGGISIPGDSGSKLPDFAEVTKDMEKTEGLFTLWYYPKGAADKDQEKLLCQIPASFLGENFMLSTSFSGGGFFTGFPLDQRVVKWELLDKQLVLVEPETRYVVDASKDVSDAVQRTYPERIRVAVDLVTKSPGGDPVIDFGRLLKSDFADIAWMTGSIGPFGGFGGGGGNINSALSTWTKKKSFPLNVEVGVDLAVSNAYPPGSYDKKMVHYSFWKLPASDYQPRVADDRVGYFLTTNQDWSKPVDTRDLFNRYVDRWHLVKRDPSLELCEPKHPIVFYIEKTVPVKYRRAVRDGIEEWNKGYEKIGFLNAIEVRQQTDDNMWKDLDPEDMRYSFFRWIVTGAGFAMGPHRANPFTGQIYDADIIFDDSMVRYYEQSAKINLPSALAAGKFSDPALAAFLEKNPEWRRPTREWETVDLTNPEMDAVRQRMQQRIGHSAMHCCQYADGMKHELAFGHAMLEGQPQEVIDNLLYQVIKEVVMHEVGHTLGLRHNFKASSVWTVDEIKQRRKEGLATVGSVMDYNPVLFFADGTTNGDFITTTIGPYDYWAIEYGYRTSPAAEKDDKEEAKDEDSEDKAKEEDAGKSEQAAVFKPSEAQAARTFNLEDLPPEIRSQIPPEALEMLKSGKAQEMMQKAAASGMMASKSFARGGASGPSFASAPSGDEAMLQKIAARSVEPELAYATDEDTTYLAPDPRVNRFDMCADSVGWAKARAELANKRLENILEWAVKDQESWYHLRSAFASLVFDKARQVNFVGRFIGGQYFNRDHRGAKDARPPFEIVDVNKQREAMAFIEETIFQDDYFTVPSEVLNHLAPSRWWHDGTSISLTMDYPVHDMIAALQWNVLFDRLFPNNLRRIHDAELKSNGSDKFTAAEYIKRLASAVWSDTTNAKRINGSAWTNNEPFVADVRRSLQREYLGLIEPMVRRAPGEVISPDLHAMVSYSLQTLSDDLAKMIETGKADFASQAHLVTCKSRIDRMLSPELDEIRPQPTFMMFGQTAGQSK